MNATKNETYKITKTKAGYIVEVEAGDTHQTKIVDDIKQAVEWIEKLKEKENAENGQ